MNRNKKLLGILLVAIVSVFFAACGGGTSHADTVYYLNHRDGDGFTDLIRDSFAAKAKDAGVAVEFRDAKGDMNLQIDQLKEQSCCWLSMAQLSCRRSKRPMRQESPSSSPTGG